MDELDRLFLRLVRAVRDARPEHLSGAFEVAELVDLVPYRLVRSDVGVETSDDFAHTVTRLLAGERGYLFADELMQDDLKAELASPNPDLAAYRAYLNARVTLSQEHTRQVLETIGSASPLPPVDPVSPVSPVSPVALVSAVVPTAAAAALVHAAKVSPGERPSPAARREGPTAPRASRHATSPRPLDPDDSTPTRAARPGCRYCGQALPEGREARFCPACGQNLLMRRCAACSAELEPAWKFCVTCGRAAAT